jgi:thiol-disulfide isomerase/thioredoxin
MDRREFLSGAAITTGALAGFGTLLNPTPALAKPPVRGEIRAFELAPSTRPRPNAKWTDADGKPVTLADFDGKVTLVNFWASWCPPCIRELPSIDRLQASMGSDKFTVVGISIDRGGKPVARRLMRRLKLKNLDLYLDRTSDAARALGLRNMPTTFLYDQKGREVGRLAGAAEWDTADAKRLLKYFVDNPGYADSLPMRPS